MSTPVRPTTQVRPTRPTPKRKKRRGIGIFIFVAVWIAFGIYSATRSSHHHYSSPRDKSDLIVVPASGTVPAGGSGVLALRLDNTGPDDLDHTVTFTFTTSAGLTMTDHGRIDEGDRVPFNPAHDCTLDPRGTRMTCDWFVEIDQSRHDTWRIPVRVASGVAPGTALRLDITAVGNSLYTDPNKANNTHVGYTVHVSKRGSAPPPVTPSRPSSPTVRPSHPSSPVAPSPTRPSSGRPSVPGGTVTAPVQPRPTSTKSHTSAAKRIRNAARDAVGPVTIVAAAVVGLALLIVISLVFMARRQRRLPLNHVPPTRNKGH